MLHPGWTRMALMFDFGGDLIAFGVAMSAVAFLVATLTSISIVRPPRRSELATCTLFMVLVCVVLSSEFLVHSAFATQ